MGEMTRILDRIEVSERTFDETRRIKGPLLVATDADRLSCPAGARVRPRQGPVVAASRASHAEAVHRDDHVWERRHKRLGGRRDGGASHGSGAIVDRERSVLSVVRRDPRGILAAPSHGICGSQLGHAIFLGHLGFRCARNNKGDGHAAP